MKIGILSDSHTKTNYQNEAIEHLKNQGVSYLVHAGDLCIEDNLISLENSNIPYVAVFGNNDASLMGFSGKYNIRKEPYYFKIKDITFKLMHLPYYLNSNTDVVIYGHLHTFTQEFTNNSLFINPGEVCAREKPLIECVVLEIKENKYIITYNYKDIITNEWKEKIFKYEK